MKGKHNCFLLVWETVDYSEHEKYRTDIGLVYYAVSSERKERKVKEYPSESIVELRRIRLGEGTALLITSDHDSVVKSICFCCTGPRPA